MVDYILKPTLTPHELLGVLQKAAARIPGWHPDHAMTGETAEELLKELLLGETKQEKNCKRYLPHPITACMRLRLRMGVNGRQKQQNFYAKNTACQNEFSGVLICSLPTGILFLVLQKSFANGIVGAVKG